MKKIKKLAKKLVTKKSKYHLKYAKKLYTKLNREEKNKKELIKCILKTRIVRENEIGLTLNKFFNKIELAEINPNDVFYYSLDFYKDYYKQNRMIGNLSIDYKRVLENSIEDFKEMLLNNIIDNEFYKNEINTLKGIENLIDRIVKKLKDNNVNQKLITYFENIKNKKATSFYEALQRILFYNQILWQTDHRLNGLGRLDKILIDYYENDIKNGKISKEEAANLIKEFMLTLNRYYKIKSNMLLGDTGQIIELGGKDIDGIYRFNDLTYIFIEKMEEIKLPDPKILLRVSEKMPRNLMELSLKCIKTGIGCPLFANDDVLIEKLIKFGFDEKDAYNYGTSACWEPYIIGKALDQNNMDALVFMEPLERVLKSENVSKINSKEELIELYKKYLEVYIDELISKANNTIWQKDPVLSLFIDNCIKENKDISEGGALYNNYGFTGVGLSNFVNSVINIDEFVFKSKEYTLKELNEIRKYNFEKNDDLVYKLKNQNLKYGTDNEEVINLSNKIIEYTTKLMDRYTNKFKGKFKFGVSSPTYIDSSRKFPASFDGRKNGEPFGVHISSDNSNAYTGLIQFASKLNYNENRFNGNVVDFIISPSFINDNFDKIVDFLMLSIKVGFFEMQINVISSDILIKARKNPREFPNLIVRVWGFSAYFKDLPDEYKDYIIERTLKSEGNSH